MSRKDALIAVHRFGFGPKPGDINYIASDPRGWLLEQIQAKPTIPKSMHHLPPASENVTDWWDAVTESVAELVRRIRNEYRQLWRAEASAKLAAAIISDDPFRERLVWFWGNHFTVSGRKAVAIGMTGGHEREAVRPYVTDRFNAMLQNAASHPGMLFYLDNYLSIGRHSQRGKAKYGGAGINENLAREILELHTIGVNGGYDQNDVIEFSKILTGWTFARRHNPDPGNFHFQALYHEPDSKTVLGKTYIENGVEEGRAMLKLLAGHKATARHLAFKMVRHFIADEPPASAVAVLTAAFLKSEGDLGEVTRALINLPEAWDPELKNFKPPQEFVVGVMRATQEEPNYNALIGVLDSFGHLPFMAPSPAGWPDISKAWLNPDGALRRARFAADVATRRKDGDQAPAALARDLTADQMSAKTIQAIITAQDAKRGLGLLLASPAMQRR